MQQAMRVMAFGIDYRRYSLFQKLTGDVLTFLGGGVQFVPFEGEITAEEAQFCVDFVIETAVLLQEFDYTVARPGLSSQG